MIVSSGADSSDPAPGQDIESALWALDRYSVAYQPAQPPDTIENVRYGS